MEMTDTNKFKLFVGRNNYILSQQYSKLGTHDAVVGNQSQVDLLDFNLLLAPKGIQICYGPEYLDVDNGSARGGLNNVIWKKDTEYKDRASPTSWALNAIEKSSQDPFFFIET